MRTDESGPEKRPEVDIDTRIAAKYSQWWGALASLESATKQLAWYRGKKWSSETDIADAQAKVADAEAAVDAARAEYQEAQTAYQGWSRFFLVKGGHIHSSTSCSTCFPTTAFGWLPELSGLTEEDAVDEYGEILCSVCFPTAPVEWTNGVNKKDAAEKAATKALAELLRSPEGMKVKKARELVSRKKRAIESDLREIERIQIFEDRIAGTGQSDEGSSDRMDRIEQLEKRIAKTAKQLTQAEKKLESALEELDERLAAD